MINRTLQALRQITSRRPRRVFSLLLVSLALLGAGLGAVALRRAAAGWAAPPQTANGPRALVNRQITVNSGRVEGSVQQLTAENTTLNSDAVITGDLFVLGSPTVQRNGQATIGSTVTGAGSAQPTTHRVTLNGQAHLNRLVTRTNAVALPTVAPPPAAAGTRNVTLNQPGQSPGDFATIRDLTLNGNYGLLAVPPGTYRNFTANGGSGFILGTAGATQPAAYNLNNLTLNGNSQLQVAGPVTLTLGNNLTLNSSMGAESNPNRLTLKIAAGDLTLNGGSALYGAVIAPSSTVTINGNSRLIGQLACDRLTVQGNGLLRITSTDVTPPVLTVQQPNAGAITNATQITVSGTVTDDSGAATVTVNGVAATIQGNNFTAIIPLTEGANTLTVTALDAAGNSTVMTRAVTRDSIAPMLSALEPANGFTTNAGSVTVSGAVTDATALTVTVNGTNAPLNGGNFFTTITLNEGVNPVLIVAVDAAGNRSEITRSVVLDTVAPDIILENLVNFSYTKNTQVTIAGSVSDSTVTTVSVNNAPVTLLNNSFSLNVPLTNEGINLVTVAARDSAGNDSSVTSSIIRDTISPALSLLSPTEGEITNTLRVQGTVSDSSPVSIEVGDFVLPVEAGGVFRSEVQIIEGAQQVTLIARDAAGNQSLLSRSVTIDRTLPVITEISPTDGATVGSSQVVSGRITDATLTIVKVNGVTANLNANGTFSSNVVSLNEGENQIVITAVDAATNEARVAFVLNGRDRTPPATPSLFPVISPTRLAFQTIEGRAEPGSVVTIAGGLNNVTAEAAIGTGLFVAHINLRAGSNLLVISATDVEGNTSPATQVAITSNPSISLPPPGSPAHINISTGNTQKGLVSFELPRPLIAIVTDQEGNPVAGVNVKFTLQTGAGAFVNGGNFIDVVTDTQGYASVRYLAGETPGLQQVRADFAGNLLTPAVFLTEILTAQPNTATTLSGIVLDQNLRALPNVLARIGGQQTVTGNDGRFTLRNVASGPHQLLELIGRNQIPLPGRWPNLTYDIDILPGVDNQLGRPFFLPKVNEGIALPLNQDNVVTRDTTYELPVREGESPIKVTAKTGTRIIFPPDVTDRRFSVTKISTNRVPMPLEDGRATSLYISVQPSGAIFETPLEVSFPNLDRLSAGSEVMLMSFDHDAGRYIQVGQGHVSSDGRVIKSDPGSGIRLGAWHALPPEPPEPEVSVLGHIQISGNPLLEGKDILETDAWVEGTRAVQISGAGGPGGTNQLITAATNSGSNAVTRLNYRATFSVPRNSPPRAYSMEARTIAQTPTLELSTRTVFIGLEKTKEVTASLTSAPSGTPKFSWSTDNDDIATVEFAAGNTAQSSPNRVIIRGGTKAGTTKIKVKYESSTNGKAQAEVQVNVVKVEFESSTGANPDCNGFDNTIVGTAPNIEPFWLTVILGGTFDLPTAGTTSQVRAKVTPSTAANMVSFAFPQADQFVAVAPLMATTSPQLLTVTSRATASGAGQNGSTFLSANLDGVEIAQLGVVVRRRLQIPLNFHFMSDNAGRPHRTNRATNMAGANTVANNYLQAVNAIIRNQVGVEFTLATVAFNQVQQNLTDVVSDIDLNAISAFGGQGLGQDVYFVWELENGEQIPTGGPGVVVYRVTASNRGTHNYVDDSATFSDAAHEHAHSLIANPRDPYVAPDGTIDARHSNPLRDLLFPHSNGRGCLIQKRDVDPLGL